MRGARSNIDFEQTASDQTERGKINVPSKSVPPGSRLLLAIGLRNLKRHILGTVACRGGMPVTGSMRRTEVVCRPADPTRLELQFYLNDRSLPTLRPVVTHCQ